MIKIEPRQDDHAAAEKTRHRKNNTRWCTQSFVDNGDSFADSTARSQFCFKNMTKEYDQNHCVHGQEYYVRIIAVVVAHSCV